jgi:hypothetical protein
MLIRTLALVLGERLEGKDMVTPTMKRLKFANRILLAGNDSQTFTGRFATVFLVLEMSFV